MFTISKKFAGGALGFISVASWLVLGFVVDVSHAAHRDSDGLHVRVGAYNVSFCSEASAAEIGKMLKSFDLDIVGLTEVPRAPVSGDLAAAVGAKHFVAGAIS